MHIYEVGGSGNGDKMKLVSKKSILKLVEQDLYESLITKTLLSDSAACGKF